MVYLTLLVPLTVFTMLDAINTVVGTQIGLIELNPVVHMLGLQSWVVFRILLLVGMLTSFHFGYQFCLRHFPQGTWILGTTLLTLDTYIITVVISGLLGIYLELL